MDDDLTLPDFLNRKLNPRSEPLPRNLSWKLKNPSKIVWPTKQIERALRAKARKAKQARKERNK